MASVRGFVSDVAWTVFWDSMTDDDVEGYLGDVFAAIKSAKAAGRQVVGLTVAVDSVGPNAAQRRRIAAFIAEHAETLGTTVPLFAYVLDSAIARGALTAVNWIVRKPFPERIFATSDEALDAITKLVPGVARAAVLKDMAARVPAAVLRPRR